MGQPYISIIASSTVVSITDPLDFFPTLVIMDIMVYGAGLVPGSSLPCSFFVLKEPARRRPFKIPLNTTGLFFHDPSPGGEYIWVAPSSGAIYASDRITVSRDLCPLVCCSPAELAWRLILWRNPGLSSHPHEYLVSVFLRLVLRVEAIIMPPQSDSPTIFCYIPQI